MTQALFDAQTALITASGAFFGGEQTRLLAEFPLLATACQKIQAVCTELAALTTADDATYERREQALSALSAVYQATCSQITDSRLKALEFNGVEIDTELMRIFLFGQNLLVAPNA